MVRPVLIVKIIKNEIMLQQQIKYPLEPKTG